jgi:hypothetical protein
MIAIATAASAAAMVMMKMVKKMPSSLSGYKYLLNATKLMLTLFSINSIAISIVIILRRVNRPYMPIKNSAVLTNKICDSGTYLLNNFWFRNNSYRSAYSTYFCFFTAASVVFCSGDLIAITIQPIIAANNNILTTSKGKT